MKRERLEDLGRLRVLLENIADMDIFSMKHSSVRKKDFVDWFRTQNEDKQNDLIEKMIYGIDAIEDYLSECIVIARGHEED